MWHTINKLKNKEHMIINKCRKAFNKIQHPLKISQQSGIKDTYLNIIKVIYDKTTASIILNSEKLKALPQRRGIRQKYPPLPLLLSIRSPSYNNQPPLTYIACSLVQFQVLHSVLLIFILFFMPLPYCFAYHSFVV